MLCEKRQTRRLPLSSSRAASKSQRPWALSFFDPSTRNPRSPSTHTRVLKVTQVGLDDIDTTRVFLLSTWDRARGDVRREMTREALGHRSAVNERSRTATRSWARGELALTSLYIDPWPARSVAAPSAGKNGRRSHRLVQLQPLAAVSSQLLSGELLATKQTHVHSNLSSNRSLTAICLQIDLFAWA